LFQSQQKSLALDLDLLGFQRFLIARRFRSAVLTITQGGRSFVRNHTTFLASCLWFDPTTNKINIHDFLGGVNCGIWSRSQIVQNRTDFRDATSKESTRK